MRTSLSTPGATAVNPPIAPPVRLSKSTNNPARVRRSGKGGREQHDRRTPNINGPFHPAIDLHAGPVDLHRVDTDPAQIREIECRLKTQADVPIRANDRTGFETSTLGSWMPFLNQSPTSLLISSVNALIAAWVICGFRSSRARH